MIYEATTDFDANEYFYPTVERIALKHHCTIMQRGNTIRVFGKKENILKVEEDLK